jgi:hypothetical protein
VLNRVSINLQKIVSDPSSGLPRGGSFGATAVVLTASVLLLVPGQATTLVATEVLAMELAA